MNDGQTSKYVKNCLDIRQKRSYDEFRSTDNKKQIVSQTESSDDKIAESNRGDDCDVNSPPKKV